MKWCKIKKRKGNAVLYGIDLGKESPAVSITIEREGVDKLPTPKVPLSLFIPRKKK